LVLEGAAQPFLLEMVANQSLSERRPVVWIIAREAYTTVAASDT
jgi:hypothetical protein